MGEITDKELEAIEALKKYGGQRVAAEALGISRASFRDRLRSAARHGVMGFKPVPEGFEISQIATRAEDGSHVKMRPERGPEFQVPEGMTVKGVSALVDGQGRVIQQWIKPTLDQVHNAIAEALEKRFAETFISVPLPAPAVTESNLLSIYPIADQHLGLLAWGRETGDAYDLKIGCARLRDCTKRLVAQSPPSETAIILNLGDWQHTDDEKNVTPGHGFTLDVDSRYFKLVQAGVDLMVDVVELALQKHQQVMVRNLPGNHDPHAHVALTMGLRGHYREHPRVTILADPSEFFYYRWHNNFIGATHGHKIKPAAMVMDMAVTRREDWSKSDYRYFYFGHIHHETAREVGDVRCESFQTLASKDAYSHSHGFTAGRSLTSITLHAQDGEIGRHRVNIPPPKRTKQ